MIQNNFLRTAVTILAVSLTIVLSHYAYATTYYIDHSTGSDTNNGTSTSTPWMRSPGMVDFSGNYSHKSGDVFVFKGGVTWPYTVFPLKIRYSGASGSPDVYMGGQRCGEAGSVTCNGGAAWGSGYPVFDGEDTGKFQSGLIAKSSANNYVTIDGLKIIRAGDLTNGSGQGILFGGGSYITIKNCWLQPNGVNAFAYSTTSGTYTALYFHDNIIKQAGRVHVTVGDSRVTDVRFYNNTMYGGYDYNPRGYHSDGFMIGGDGIDDYAIQGLYIYNNKFTGAWERYATAQLYLNGLAYSCYDYENGSHQPTAGQVVIGETSGVKGKVYSVINKGGWRGAGKGTICVSSSKFKNGEKLIKGQKHGGVFVGKVASAPVAAGRKSTRDVYIYNNLFVTEHKSGKTFSPGTIVIGFGHSDVKIYNNTIDARSNADMNPAHGIFLGLFVKNVNIKNNILSGCLNGITLGSDTVDGIIMDHNLYDTVKGGRLIWDNRVPKLYNTLEACQSAGHELHGKTGDPRFVRLPKGGVVGSGDWHLQPDSPALIGGANLGAPYTADIDGIIGSTRIGASSEK